MSDLVDVSFGGKTVLSRYGKKNTSAKAQWKALEDVFEDKVCDAFRFAGLSVLQLGHKKQGKREPDGIARYPSNPSFVVMFDSKVSKKGYSIRTDERALREYVEKWDPRLRDQNFEKLYLAIVSSSFRGENQKAITRLLKRAHDTLLDRVVLVPTDVLIQLASIGIRDPRLDRSFFEAVFESGPELKVAGIDRAYGDRCEQWGL